MGTPPPIQIANIGMADSLILMVLALVVFGPRRLPLIGRQIGKLMYEFRKASNDFKFQMEEELRNSEEADRRKKEEDERQRALAATPSPPQLEQTNTPASESAAATSESGASAPTSDSSSNSSVPDSSDSSDREPVSAGIPAEEPYPSASEPALPPASEEAAPPQDVSAISPQTDATAPRIQPPTTGEKVVANNPVAALPTAEPQQQELFGPTESGPAKAPETVTPEAERSEPAAHHG